MKKPLNIHITERDIEILSFINEFGFCESSQLKKQFKLKKARSHQLFSRYKKAKLVHHLRLFYRRHGTYFLTKKGAAHTSLPALRKITLRDYVHHLTVVDVSMRLKELYPQSRWISERRLSTKQYAEDVDMKGHLPDGVLLLPWEDNNSAFVPTTAVDKPDMKGEKNKIIAIEVELSLKSKNRTNEILRKYMFHGKFKEVWYYCDPQVIAHITTAAQKMPFVKVFNIGEFLK